MKQKHLYNIFHVVVNANSKVQHVIQINNEIIINISVNVKIIVCVKKDYSCNPSTCICENNRFLKMYS